MVKTRPDKNRLREELNAIVNEADPIEKFDRIKSFFERHHPGAPVRRPLLKKQMPTGSRQ
jgi:hypothetical protein